MIADAAAPDADANANAAGPASDVPRFPSRPQPSQPPQLQPQPTQTRGEITINVSAVTARPLRTLTLLALLALVTAVALKHNELLTWWHVGGVTPPVVYGLSLTMPDGMCDELTPDDIRNDTARDDTVNLRDVRASLLHWMRKGDKDGHRLQGICARYLERSGVCYCIVNMVRTPGEPDNLIDMFNMEIIGTSPDSLLRNYERSVICKKEIETVRFSTITVRWLNGDGVMREREVSGLAAQTIQQIDAVQRGEGSCRDSNIEVALAAINKKVNDLRLRTIYNTPGNVAMLTPDLAQQYKREHNANRRQLAAQN
jgi:hypothetical protein